MAAPKVIGIDYEVGQLGKSIKLHSPENLGEAEMVLLGPDAISGLKRINRSGSETVSRFTEMLMSSVNRGLILVVLLDRSFVAKFGGTNVNLEDYEPFSYIQAARLEKGEAVVPLEDSYEIFKRIDAGFIENLNYQIVIENSSATPLLVAGKGHDGPDKIIACYQHVGKGLVLFMPSGSLSKPHYTGKLRALSFSILQQETIPPEAEWSEDFCFQDEIPLRQEILSQKKKITDAKQTIIDVQEKISEHYKPLKKLFTASDKPFEEAVKNALEKIGYKVEFGPKGHADLLAYDGSTLVVVEAKGILGAVKEGHITQANKWTAEVDTVLSTEKEEITDTIDKTYLECMTKLGLVTGEKREIQYSKGLVVCNTYCQTPLNERGKDFYANVPENLKRRHICGLTGVQLLGILLDVRSNPNAANDYREQLATTDGVFEGFEDFSKFLSVAAKPMNDNKELKTGTEKENL